MPWLEKYTDVPVPTSDSDSDSDDKDSPDTSTSTSTSPTTMKPSDNLLFVHVPRCGGTSLMKAHDLPQKAEAAAHTRSGWNRFGMRTFFHRYALLEKDNFPFWTEGNAASLMVFTIGCFLLQIESVDYRVLAILMIVASVVLFTCLTFIFVAPTIARIPCIRRAYLIFVHYICFRFMENLTYVTGTNLHGYLNHLTCAKMIQYGYVTPLELQSCSSLAIVRNPYARMVSLYMYNRFGRFESFQHFVRTWHRSTFRHYRERGEMEDWYTPCHAIPQFEYTHVRVQVENESGRDGTATVSHDKDDDCVVTVVCDNDPQQKKRYDLVPVVHAIVKQEELKLLKQVVAQRSQSQPNREDKIDSVGTSIHQLPAIVEDALLNMPHDNKRTTTKPWYQYFDQEALDLTYEMYHADFDVFGYTPILEQRPDLLPPKLFRDKKGLSLQVDLEKADCATTPRSTSTTPDSSASSLVGMSSYQKEGAGGFY